MTTKGHTNNNKALFNDQSLDETDNEKTSSLAVAGICQRRSASL
jgi:hypothetical protein